MRSPMSSVIIFVSMGPALSRSHWLYCKKFWQIWTSHDSIEMTEALFTFQGELFVSDNGLPNIDYRKAHMFEHRQLYNIKPCLYGRIAALFRAVAFRSDRKWVTFTTLSRSWVLPHSITP